MMRLSIAFFPYQFVVWLNQSCKKHDDNVEDEGKTSNSCKLFNFPFLDQENSALSVFAVNTILLQWRKSNRIIDG